MSYRVIQRQITDKSPIFSYLSSNAKLAKLLYNAALFRIRQIFTGYDKDTLTDKQKQVFDEVDLLTGRYPNIKVKKVISYSHLEKMMRVNGNPDFFSGLPMQTAQAVVKQAVADFKNWLTALRDYGRHPEKYLGKPKMPHYKKTSEATFVISNQDAVLYFTEESTYLKLPLTKDRLCFSNIENGSVLKEAKIKPFYGRYILLLTLEVPNVNIDNEKLNICSIDFGTDNFAAVVCNDGSSVLYKGGAVLSCCQWFHKSRAEAAGIITRGHDRLHAASKRLNSMSIYHHNFVFDQCHKISRSIISYCISHNSGTLVLGENKYWKQSSDMGKISNQKFVSMPVSILKKMLIYKAAGAGIQVILQEESYTSQADITSMDYIPVYGVDDDRAAFSGRRIKRGLYKCANGLLVNADCNGAANIMRKAIPDAWNGMADFSFLSDPEVLGFHELNPQSNPAEGIGAA